MVIAHIEFAWLFEEKIILSDSRTKNSKIRLTLGCLGFYLSVLFLMSF